MLVWWQMAQSNVGSLLVFDSTKTPRGKEVTSAAADAVVGIVTERGNSLLPILVSRSAPRFMLLRGV